MPNLEEEWSRVCEYVVGAQLLAISPGSLRRYASGARATPDDVAWRLHALGRILAALIGSYDAHGVRRWFERPRAQLDGRKPAELFSAAAGEDDPGLLQVVDLAEAIGGAGQASTLPL